MWQSERGCGKHAWQALMSVSDVNFVVGELLKGSWFRFACTGPFGGSVKGLPRAQGRHGWW